MSVTRRPTRPVTDPFERSMCVSAMRAAVLYARTPAPAGLIGWRLPPLPQDTLDTAAVTDARDTFATQIGL